MQKGDKVKVLPNKKIGIVDRVEDGFIFLVDDHRPYMRGQLDYVKSIYDEALEEMQNYINEYGMDYYDTKHYPITIKALERAKKVEEFIQSIADDEDTPVWMKVYINNFIEEELK